MKLRLQGEGQYPSPSDDAFIDALDARAQSDELAPVVEPLVPLGARPHYGTSPAWGPIVVEAFVDFPEPRQTYLGR